MASRTVVLVMVAAALAAGQAQARQDILASFQARYPSTTLDNRYGCNTCHSVASFFGPSCYRDELILGINMGLTVDQALARAEPLDSDGDGRCNLVEILAERPDQANQVGYHPSYIGAQGREACVVNTPIASNVLETPPAGQCPSDLTGDGLALAGDLRIVLALQGALSGCGADTNADLAIDVRDLAGQLSRNRASCTP